MNHKGLRYTFVIFDIYFGKTYGQEILLRGFARNLKEEDSNQRRRVRAQRVNFTEN